MQALPSGCADLIFADPPYNLQLENALYRPNMTKVDAVTDHWDQFGDFAEYDAFTEAWLTACRHVLSDTGTIWVIGSYHNIYRVGKIMMDLGYWLLNDILWVKTNPMPNFRGVRFTNAHETLIWAQKKRGVRYTFNHQAMKALNDDLQMRSDWALPLCTGKERLKVNGEKAHATQKPEALLYRVILASSKPADVVLDPFFGTGTTGVVAKKLKRRWIGIERDAGYVKVAQARLDALPAPAEAEAIYHVDDKRSLPRVAFGALLERGLLQPGQKLYFGPKGEIQATVLANGQLRYKGEVGSIHAIGQQIRKAPCNGWEHWHYEDGQTGERAPINTLRELVRKENK